MYCQNCSTENSETRKFCKECGSLIVAFCAKCGFANSQSDKFCGGCGADLLALTASGPAESNSFPGSSKTYSYDISELVDDASLSKGKQQKKKDKTKNEKVSQDLIDSIFGPEDSETEEEES